MATLEDYGYKPAPLAPAQCISDAWAVIQPQYWLFFGMCFVASMIMGTVGFLAGPMILGLAYCVDKARRDETIDFSMSFYGFNNPHVGPAFIVTLIYIAIIFAAVMVMYVFMFIGMFSLNVSPAGPNGSQEVSTAFGLVMGGGVCCMYGGIGALAMMSQYWLTFALMLIIDRKAPTGDAILLATKLLFKHFFPLIGLSILLSLLYIVGMLALCIGSLFVYPLLYAAPVIAYRRWFSDRPGGAEDFFPNAPDLTGGSSHPGPPPVSQM